MTKHLFATIVTTTAVAANNRGEGDGSTLSTLQKITRGNDQYTTVSAEAIRWGLREYFQNHYEKETNRTFNPETDRYSFKDEKFSAEKYIDDDLFGYMDAKKGKDNEDATTKRRGALEISRAMSLDPYWGDIAFGSKGGEKGKTSIHSTEVHCTAYQYTIALTPESLKKPERALLALDAIGAVRHVGGNHARFLYDFRPESIVLRITDDPSPWIMDVFKRIGESVGCPRLVRLVEVGDVKADELIVGGEIADTPYGQQLKALGVQVYRGVKEAIAHAKEQLKQQLKLEVPV
ncbi:MULTISPECIES: type I-B CRISPR-associated protein Cas7/Cst2/DevR [unclassified Thermosynechococcus]|uniref:type I-B CRISPR-associated protein Cas7/Cst2/DevR n=1 Tax=unclassified Thermosynechococcus TaxID=2622553 RepID=UPI0019806ECA|nr:MULTISPECIES: type I-B CRISPR-associated protein Cas7/Cst2/DevR [unclassified Thermosynechococcus]QSF50106.1 type I-B CRISPR-associated protein Cas7/Cst2/DevR [Thermosynechococcus sp. TA-1]WKT82158.1 type I-B CRISPR-associated protein Cas7/Cst2/DevR [Thermosynechococcus sp. PP45]WNC23219.1 type I-B CRISPR-associated protein Cas7/Cst2/DevR [Thermosynechococcus sp. PP22]WNC25776.1 type I-B CRISPR-associated protein Cas7/Cst2/DevR [Thermosynechococcus sp. PP551]WNC28355.1 type I-B CRISPR-assoc